MRRFEHAPVHRHTCRILAWVALVGGLLGGLLAILIAVIGGRIEVPAFRGMQPYMSSTAGAVIFGLSSPPRRWFAFSSCRLRRT